MWSSERKVPRFKCLSCEHAFSCSNNLYKHYRTFTDHRLQPKIIAKLQGGHRFISRQGLKPLSMESQTSGTFQNESSPVMNSWNSLFRRTQKLFKKASSFTKSARKKSGETKKAAVKNEFIELCVHIFRARQAISPIFGRLKREKVPVRAVNSLACKIILNWGGGKVFKSTLIPMFVKRYHEAFLEFDLGLVSSFNIGQNQVNSILRGH